MILNRLFKSLFSSRQGAERALSALDSARRLINLRQIDEASRILDSLPESDLKSAKALNLLGEVAFYRREDEKAEALFRAALNDKPESLDGHYGLSKLLFEQGRFQDAVLHAHYCQTHDKSNAQYAAHAALCFLGVGDPGQAYWSANKAVKLEPLVARYWNDLALAQRMLGRFSDAEHGFKRALALDPELTQARQNLAELHAEMQAGHTPRNSTSAAKDVGQNHPDAAATGEATTSPEDMNADTEIKPLADIRKGKLISREIEDAEARFARSPDSIEVALELARLLENDGQVPEAIDVLTIALEHHPDNLEARRMRGYFHKRMNHPRKAEADLVKVAKKLPDDPELLSTIADTYVKGGVFDEALKYRERCVAVSNDTGHAVQLGNLYVAVGRYEEGLRLFDSILEREPTAKPSIDFGYAVALFFLGEFEKARPYIERAIQLTPYNADARFLRGSLNLITGNFAAGWEDYRYRVFSDQETVIRLLPMPLWSGESVEGKCILLLAEQGLGDQIMFASVIRDLLAKRPGQVIIEAHKRIAKTLARSFKDCLVIPTSQAARFDWLKTLPPIDYYAPIAELARIFRPDEDSFPRHAGYLMADPQRVAFWKDRLSALGSGMKIGISWRGGVDRTRRAVRSLPLTALEGILRMPNTRFISLQYGEVTAEVKEASDALGIPIAHWPEGIADLDEFAALLSALDLVISVCNTTVHFAGALNRPVWVMTPRIPEWRYGLLADSMVWYPSARMFRQPEHGDWESVLREVGETLKKKLSQEELA